MKENIKIVGFYKRERDKNEYVYYLEDGIEHLTNGIYDWSNINDKGRIKRYMKQLSKVEKINISVVVENMKKHIPFHPIVKYLINEVEKMENVE